MYVIAEGSVVVAVMQDVVDDELRYYRNIPIVKVHRDIPMTTTHRNISITDQRKRWWSHRRAAPRVAYIT